MNRLKMMVVGCGDIAGFMGLVSRLTPQVALWACCDVNPDRAQSFARRHGIRQVFTNYTEALEKSGAQAVYLAVPHDLHYPMILEAAAAGKAVMVEKPLTRTLDEARQVVAAAAGAKVGVNYQYRYDSGCHALARAVQAGALGQVHAIRINIPWRRGADYFAGAPWHKTIARAGGGTLITQGSHFLDVALWALGEPPLSAMGYIASPGFDVEVDTLCHAIVQTRSGTLVNIASSMVSASEQTVSIEVYGARGTAMYRDQPLPAVRFTGVRLRPERPPVWGVHALQRSLAGFANWVLRDVSYLIPAAEALPVLAAVDAIYRSAASGQREQVAGL